MRLIITKNYEELSKVEVNEIASIVKKQRFQRPV